MTEMRSINKTILIGEIRQREAEMVALSKKDYSGNAQEAVNTAFHVCRLRSEIGAITAVLNSLE